MKTAEIVFDGKEHYIMSHRELGLGVFGGHARYEWAKKKLNVDKLNMVSKDVFEVLKKNTDLLRLKNSSNAVIAQLV